MAKFYGVIGYAIQEEIRPGVWKDVITERNYRGDVIQHANRWDSAEQVNDNFNISNRLSVIADLFSYENFQYMKYIIWHNTKWKITRIEINRPRMILTIGGVYNGTTN